MTPAERFDLPRMLRAWSWLVPGRDTPLFVSGMGDWVFGAPDGSLWCLDVLEGTYSRIAADAAEYNTLNKNPAWLEEKFSVAWFDIALQNGLVPTESQCIGWKLHPLIGGKFDAGNLRVFDMVVYQSLMGQLHQQLQRNAGPSPARKSWYRLW
jgi:hypothetical protein